MALLIGLAVLIAWAGLSIIAICLYRVAEWAVEETEAWWTERRRVL
jgi:hypothetical protein